MHDTLYTDIRSFASADAKAGTVGEETGVRKRQAIPVYMRNGKTADFLPNQRQFGTPIARGYFTSSGCF